MQIRLKDLNNGITRRELLISVGTVIGIFMIMIWGRYGRRRERTEMRVVRAGDQSREGRALSPRVAEERHNKDVLHAAYVRPRRAGGSRGRRAGKGVTSREPKPHIEDITTRRLMPQDHLLGGASGAVSRRWRAIACPNTPPGRRPFTRQLRRRLLRSSATLASFLTMDEGIAPWGEEELT